MSSFKDPNVASHPIAARSAAEGSGKWSVGMKAAAGLLCVALLAAGATGLAIGISRRENDNSTTVAASNDAGTAASREVGTSTGSTTGTETGSSTDATDNAGSGASCSAGSECTTVDTGDTDAITAPGDCGSIIDVALATPELSTLVTAIQAANLTLALSDKESEYTLLAPSNSALAKIPQEQLSTVMADTTMLTNVLNQHLSTVAVASSAFLDGRQLATVTGGFLDVSVSAGSVSFTTSDGASTATVTTADIQTCKGYVHIIDSVLLRADVLPAGALAPGEAALAPGEAALAPGAAADAPGAAADAPGAAALAPGAVEIQVGLLPHANGVTRGEDGTYSVCSGRWAPEMFSGPEPCGIRVRSTGVVNVGAEFGGANGYFSDDAADGLDNPCFKTSLANMFGQKLCAFNKVAEGIDCLAEADGTPCVCVAPFGEPAIRVNNRKWAGNIEFNTFLKRVRGSANLVDSAAEAASNRVKLEETLVKLLSVTDCV